MSGYRPTNLYDYIEYYGEDPRDLGPDENAECNGCEERFYIHWLPATRTDPACPESDVCPNCGSDDWREL